MCVVEKLRTSFDNSVSNESKYLLNQYANAGSVYFKQAAFIKASAFKRNINY